MKIGPRERISSPWPIVEPNGPAAMAGLMKFDMVYSLDGVPVTGVDDLIRLLGAERIGRGVEIGVMRLGKPRTVQLKPVERVAPKAARRS